jgi:MATE family multidrug resistance protein
MPIFGLSTVASILVGQYLGRNQTELATCSVRTTLVLALAYMGIISTLYILTPDLFLFGFFASDSQEQRAATRGIAVVLLRYIAAYNLFDAMNLVFAGAIKGAGDTHFVLYVSVFMALVLAIGSWLTIEWFAGGLHACWQLVTLWVIGLGVIYWLRFQAGKWKSMRVIEPELRVEC